MEDCHRGQGERKSSHTSPRRDSPVRINRTSKVSRKERDARGAEPNLGYIFDATPDLRRG